MDHIHREPVLEGFDNDLGELCIEGLRLHLDRTGDRPLFGSLQAAVERLAGGSGDGAGSSNSAPSEGAHLPSLPKVVLADAEAILQTPSGPLKIGRASCRDRVCQYV